MDSKSFVTRRTGSGRGNTLCHSSTYAMRGAEQRSKKQLRGVRYLLKSILLKCPDFTQMGIPATKNDVPIVEYNIGTIMREFVVHRLIVTRYLGTLGNSKKLDNIATESFRIFSNECKANGKYLSVTKDERNLFYTNYFRCTESVRFL